MVHHFTIGRQKDFALASQEVIDFALRAILGLELLRRYLNIEGLTNLIVVGVCWIVDH